jgi:hypothetical protein
MAITDLHVPPVGIATGPANLNRGCAPKTTESDIQSVEQTADLAHAPTPDLNSTTRELAFPDADIATEDDAAFQRVHPNVEIDRTELEAHTADGPVAEASAEFEGVHHSQDRASSQNDNGDLFRDQQNSSDENHAKRHNEPETDTWFGGVYLDNDCLVDPRERVSEAASSTAPHIHHAHPSSAELSDDHLAWLDEAIEAPANANPRCAPENAEPQPLATARELADADPTLGGTPENDPISELITDEEEGSLGVHPQNPAELDQANQGAPADDSLDPTEVVTTATDDRAESKSDENFDRAHLDDIEAQAPADLVIEAFTTSSDEAIDRVHLTSIELDELFDGPAHLTRECAPKTTESDIQSVEQAADLAHAPILDLNSTTRELAFPDADTTAEDDEALQRVHPNVKIDRAEPEAHAADGLVAEASAEFEGVHSQSGTSSQDNNEDRFKDQHSSIDKGHAEKRTEPESDTWFGGVYLDNECLVEPRARAGDPASSTAPHIHGAHRDDIEDTDLQTPVDLELGETTPSQIKVSTSSDSETHRVHPNSPSTPDGISESVVADELFETLWTAADGIAVVRPIEGATTAPDVETKFGSAPQIEEGECALTLTARNLDVPSDPMRAALSEPSVITIRQLAIPDDLASRGVHPQNPTDPDEKINEALVEYQLRLRDWKLGPAINLSRLLEQALGWYQQMNADGLIPTKWAGVGLKLPDHIRITFDARAANIIASYTPGRALRDGTRWNINLNPVAIIHHRRSPLLLASDLLHELLHLLEHEYRQVSGKSPVKGSYHSVEFREACQDLGIPCTQNGAELEMTPGGRFQQWAMGRELSTEFEFALPSESGDDDQQRPAKRPKRIAWRCRCENAPAVMVARASKIDWTCNVCKCPVLPVEPKGASTKS